MFLLISYDMMDDQLNSQALNNVESCRKFEGMEALSCGIVKSFVFLAVHF
jgi:hypothetical protein